MTATLCKVFCTNLLINSPSWDFQSVLAWVTLQWSHRYGKVQLHSSWKRNEQNVLRLRGCMYTENKAQLPEPFCAHTYLCTNGLTSTETLNRNKIGPVGPVDKGKWLEFTLQKFCFVKPTVNVNQSLYIKVITQSLFTHRFQILH